MLQQHKPPDVGKVMTFMSADHARQVSRDHVTSGSRAGPSACHPKSSILGGCRYSWRVNAYMVLSEIGPALGVRKVSTLHTAVTFHRAQTRTLRGRGSCDWPRTRRWTASTPATGSCPRTPTLRGAAARKASSSLAPSRRPSRCADARHEPMFSLATRALCGAVQGPE